ncbi:putative disease resistance protein RGA1 isoform X2 [Herrania umbratica]|uniref:Disease resistance protein RGA1 isoform X2 n=1 Tax=Herrania umbratica TaxID=108875 RepID=A0A6J1A3A4_9ROSI|nr:putative disease resistance protein RGA1 isoform X2 [Herrania umbratica]
MEAIVASVSDVMLSALFRSLFETLSSPDFLKFSREERVWAEIKKWKNLLLKINALLQDAEEKQTTSRAVKLWLTDLQHVAFDAEDVVDELATESSRRKLLELAQPSASTRTLWKVILPTCCSALNPNGIKFNAKMNSKIQEITSRLHELAALKNDLNLVEFSGGRPERVLQRLPTSSLVDEPHVYGRERDKDAIVDMLMDSGEMGRGEIGVVSIVGMAGVGKTTLAQLVYHDERIETSFELRAWVCVTEDFDVLRVTKTVLHAVDSDIGNSQDLNLLQVWLKEKLTGRKFLIILDDLWNENYEDWDVLCKPFAAGAPGSKVLVTTRHKRVAAVTAVTANNEAYHLKELSDDACLSLFTWHALRARNFDGHPNLKVVGEQIVRKCKGLPLAAKTLGGLLRTKVTQEEWEDILMSKIWDLPEERSGILPALRLSYHHLPFYLKRCFGYCAIFPKDYEFDKDELVLLWMAEGFLQQLKGKTRMEDLGSQYFNELLSRSIFQQSTSNKARYVMHDLINDLAQSVSDEICSSLDDMDIVEGDKLCTVAEKVRYLSFTRRQYDIRKRFEGLYRMKNLRTLAALPICTSPWSACCYLAGDVLQKMLRRLSCLRVLCLSCYCINELPNSIGHLKHLRYLNLSRSRITQLPESVGSLLNLQTLILQGCKELTKLPQGFKNLVNLRVLDLTDTDSLQEMPLGIGNLKNLQILSKFIVGRGSGSAVSELRGLLHLRGELSISGLENVVDIQDASKANLKDKYGLTRLCLQWSHEFLDCQNEEAEMHVLDRLLPHKILEKLRILFYGGTIFPSWLGMDRVQKVGLEFYGHISPSVKPFPSLEILRFKSMLEWRCWSSPNQVNEHSGEEFPCLRELVIEYCPKLCGKLPGRVFSLMKLVIKHCPNLEGSSVSFPSLCELNMEDCKEELLRSIVGITSLTTVRAKSMPELQFVQNEIAQFPGALKFLVISNCIGLTSLWQKGAISLNISCLESLKIKGQSQFVSLSENDQGLSSNLEDLRLLNSCSVWKPPWMMPALTSLKDLQIESCPNLVFFPEVGFLHTLKHLKLKDCQALKSLPSGMMMLNCKINGCPLEELEIEDCHSLTCFPRGRLPTTLKCIRIRYCTDLMSLPEGLMQIDNSASNISLLEILEIVACPSLISFPKGRLPTSLKNLKIWNCSKLEPLSNRMLHKYASLESIDVWNCANLISLPENLHNGTHLTELKFGLCPALRYFPETGMHLPNLRTLDIYKCDSLMSLPDHMLSLTSLRCLSVSECPGLLSIPKGGLPPNLSVFEIWDCQNLKQPMSEWNLHSLAFLRELSIAGGPDTVTFPDEKCLLPTSLVSMFISRLQNLQSLSMGLYNLTLLEDLEIVECPKLQRLPKEGLPETLGRLCIRDCQLLNQHCLKEKGAYWPVIAHIPRLEITDD